MKTEPAPPAPDDLGWISHDEFVTYIAHFEARPRFDFAMEKHRIRQKVKYARKIGQVSWKYDGKGALMLDASEAFLWARKKFPVLQRLRLPIPTQTGRFEGTLAALQCQGFGVQVPNDLAEVQRLYRDCAYSRHQLQQERERLLERIRILEAENMQLLKKCPGRPRK
jgi:hypothetical protein